MKKIIFPILLCSFLFTGFQLIAQTPWYVGGNAIAGAARIGSTSNQSVVFITNNRERGRLDSNGNWGFGVLSSSDKVRINTPVGSIPFRAMVNGQTKLLVHSGGGVSIGDNIVPPANGLYVATRIGIATATPAYGLDVRGSTAFGQFKSTGGFAGVLIDKSAAGQNGYILHRTAGVDKWTEGTIGNDNFSLRNWGLGSNALIVDITNNNVGIGTVSATAKLNVVGSTSSGTGINTSGYNYGILSNATYTYGYGVYGTSPFVGVYGAGGASGGSYGTYGYSNYVGAYGSGSTYGTYGYALSGGAAGAYGYSEASNGVQGVSISGYGGYFESGNNYGLVSTTTNGVYAGVFYGAVWSSAGYSTSDKNLKRDIKDFGDAMSIINKLKPQDYLFKDDAKYTSLHLPKGRHYGLLAQDVEQVLPNLVSEAPHQLTIKSQPTAVIKPTADGKPQPIVAETKETKETINIKAVNYVELIPIVVKGMQEQDIKIQEQEIKMQKQEAEISNLKNEINELKALIKNTNGSAATTVAAYLKQNNPNPLKGNTVIKYFAPADARNAQILVTDMKGSILKTYKISNGEGQLTIRSGELPSGTYNYTLYVNNAKIDTKQMIIAR